jgi:hypothetical protein
MKIKENLKIREIAGEKIVILEKGSQVEFTNVMVLNETAEWLWNQLMGKEFENNDVSRLLLEKFDVDQVAATNDALNWIETLKKNEVIE